MARNIRLMAVTPPVAGTDYSEEQTEKVYAVTTDNTFWLGEWKQGKFGWTELPAPPSGGAHVE